MTVRSRTLQRGDPNEATWLSDMPSGEKGLFVFREGKAVRVEYGDAEPSLTPFIHVDSMPLQLHPSNGKPVESKSQFKRIMKAHGHEDRTGAPMVADNKPKFKGMSDDDYMRDVKIATEMVRSGTAPLSEYDREKCKRINQQLKNRP